MTHRYIIVAACMTGLAISFAPIFHLSVFLKPLSEQFGWTRAQVSGGGTLAMLSIAAVAPFIGRLVDRFGPRRVIALSSAAFAASVALLAFNKGSYPLFVANVILIGVTGAGTTPLTYLALIARWFDKRLGLALGITMMGIGIGLAITAPLSNYLIETGGLSHAFLVLAALASLGMFNALFFLREPPQSPTDPVLPVAAAPARSSNVRADLGEIFAQSQFWIIFAAMTLMMLVVAGAGIHFIALMTDRGWSGASAAATASLIGIAVLSGRLLAGFLLDYFPARLVGGVTFALGTLGVTMLALGWGGYVPVVAAICIGFAQGAEGDLLAYLVKRKFRPEIYGLTYGLVFAAFNLGAFGGPTMMGAGFDANGNYDAVLWMLVAAGCVATLLISLVTPGAAQKPARTSPAAAPEAQ